MALPSLSTTKHELTVPSTGDRIEYRPYLVKEEKLLMIASETGDEQDMIRAIKEMISSCTFGAVNVEKITMFDLEYIFVQLRARSVGENSAVKLTCQKCGHKNESKIDLTSIQLSEAGEMKIDLDGTIGVMMRYPTVNDVVDGSGGSDIDTIFNTIFACIDYIYQGDEVFDAKDHSKQELEDFIDSLSNAQFKKIEEFVTGMPKCYIDTQYTCQECGEHNDLHIEGLGNFFG